MSGHRNILRWLAVLTAVVLLAAACGSDSGDASPFAPPNESGSADTGAPDPGSPDTGASDPGAPDPGSPDTDASDPGAPDLSPAALGATDCAAIETAFSSAGGVFGEAGQDGDDLRASLDQYRAQLEALRSEAPQLSDDIDTSIAGLEVLATAYAGFDWDLTNLSDPQDALALASLMTDADVMGMSLSMVNIGIWVAENCAG
jgi:hypothetical protein